jgi:hypothetical protein
MKDLTTYGLSFVAYATLLAGAMYLLNGGVEEAPPVDTYEEESSSITAGAPADEDPKVIIVEKECPVCPQVTQVCMLDGQFVTFQHYTSTGEDKEGYITFVKGNDVVKLDANLCQDVVAEPNFEHCPPPPDDGTPTGDTLKR